MSRSNDDTITVNNPEMARQKLFRKLLEFMRDPELQEIMRQFDQLDAVEQFLGMKPASNGRPPQKAATPSLEEPPAPERKKYQRVAKRSDMAAVRKALTDLLRTQPGGLLTEQMADYARARRLIDPKMTPNSATGICREVMRDLIDAKLVRPERAISASGHAAWRYLPTKRLLGTAQPAAAPAVAEKKPVSKPGPVSRGKRPWPYGAELDRLLSEILLPASEPMRPVEVKDILVQQRGYAERSASGKDRFSNVIARRLRELGEDGHVERHTLPPGPAGSTIGYTIRRPAPPVPPLDNSVET